MLRITGSPFLCVHRCMQVYTCIQGCAGVFRCMQVHRGVFRCTLRFSQYCPNPPVQTFIYILFSFGNNSLYIGKTWSASVLCSVEVPCGELHLPDIWEPRGTTTVGPTDGPTDGRTDGHCVGLEPNGPTQFARPPAANQRAALDEKGTSTCNRLK